MTIRKRFALWYSGLLTLLIVVFGIAVITVSRLTLLNTIDAVLLADATHVVNNIDIVAVQEFTTQAQDRIFIVDEDLFYAPDANIQVWQLYEDGELITSPRLVRRSSALETMTLPLYDTFLDNTQPPMVYASSRVRNRDLRVVTLPYYDREGNTVGVVQVAMPLFGVMDANNRLLVISIIAAMVVSAISILLGDWLSAYLLRPIEDVSDAAAKIATADDLSVRLEWHGADDELGRLTTTYNHMMERLEHVFDVQKHFIGDVSHELRTPLTSIMGNVELMLKYGVNQEDLEAVHRESQRMKRRVDELLMLSRADAGTLEVTKYSIDLDSIIEDAMRHIADRLEGRDLALTLTKIEPIRMYGSGERLLELVANLLNNAIQFTPDGGKIELRLFKENTNAIIEVQDTGVGIADEDLPLIFERFYQSDSSRARNSEWDGIGIGLTMARWIARTHEGTINVTSELGKGSTFRVVLPIRQSVEDNPDDNIEFDPTSSSVNITRNTSA